MTYLMNPVEAAVLSKMTGYTYEPVEDITPPFITPAEDEAPIHFRSEIVEGYYREGDEKFFYQIEDQI